MSTRLSTRDSRARSSRRGHRAILFGAAAALFASGVIPAIAHADSADEADDADTAEVVDETSVEVEVETVVEAALDADPEPAEEAAPPVDEPADAVEPAEAPEPEAEAPTADAEAPASETKSASEEEAPVEAPVESPAEENAATDDEIAVEQDDDAEASETLKALDAIEPASEVTPLDAYIQVCVGRAIDCLVGEPTGISQWELERTGIEFEARGFDPGSEVEILLNGAAFATMTANDDGRIEGVLHAELSPGIHEVTASAAEGSGTSSFQAVADSQWWSDFDDEPYFTQNHTVRTVEELAEEPVEFYVTDYPYDTPVEIYVNGAYAETVQHDFFFRWDIQGEFSPGPLTVEFRHPVETLTATIDVVGEDGDLPPAGEYVGESVQTHAGTSEMTDPRVRAFTFEVDDNGHITNLTGEVFWVCVPADPNFGTFYLQDTDFPDTRITVDQPFEIMWDDGRDLTLAGTVNADGTAQGTYYFNHGVCGGSRANWSTALDGELPDPEPEPEVVEAEAPTQDGNVVTIPSVEGVSYIGDEDAVLSGTVTLTEGQTLTVTAIPEDGYTLADGPTQWEFEYEAPDPDPEPEIVEAVEPAFEENVVTIPTVEGVSYVDGDGNVLSGEVILVEGQTLVVTATANDGYELADGDHQWSFEFEEITDPDPEPEPIEVEAEAPTRDGNTVTIPVIEGVTYVDGADAVITGSVTLVEGQTLTVTAVAEDGYELADGVTEWVFEYAAADPDPTPEPEPEPDPTDPVDPEPTDPGDDNGGDGSGDGSDDDNGGNGDGSGDGTDGDGTGSGDGDGSGSDDTSTGSGDKRTGGSTEPTTPATGPDGAQVALTIMALLLAGGAILVITTRRLNVLK